MCILVSFHCEAAHVALLAEQAALGGREVEPALNWHVAVDVPLHRG